MSPTPPRLAQTDQQILTWLQRRVQEPTDDPGVWPSGLWTSDEVLGYLNQRLQVFVRDTGVNVSLAADIPVLPGQGEVPLPQDLVGIRRVAWVADTGLLTPLDPVSSFALDTLAAPSTQATPARPIGYLWNVDSPQGYVRIGPVPNQPGALRILYLATGDVLDGTGQILILPPECVPCYRFGVLADMLKKPGRGQDLPRAAVADWWWRLGIAATQIRAAGAL